MRQGKATINTRTARRTSLNRGHDWELMVNLDRKFVLPYFVESNLRPEAVKVSHQSRTHVAIELTVPEEEDFEEAHERKTQVSLGCIWKIHENEQLKMHK